MPHVTAHERLYAREFILTWQRDSRYGRADVIADSKNGFEQDENSDYAVAEHGDTVLASVVNARKRKNVAEPGQFRVTAVWLRRDRAWRMAMLQPSRIVGSSIGVCSGTGKTGRIAPKTPDTGPRRTARHGRLLLADH